MSDTLIKLRIGIVLVMTALLSYWVIRYMGLAPVGVDDANILFVYSKHLAMGEGLVYNIGGERVEGFSSMSWMLIAAVAYLFSDYPYPALLLLNILLVGGALGYMIHFVEQRFGDRVGGSVLPFSLAGMVFLAWVAANPSFFLWTVASLMETGLWASLLLATAVFLLKAVDAGRVDARATTILSVLMAMLVLTRPEGIAWVLTFSTLLLLIVRAQGAGPGQIARVVGTVAGVAAATFGLLVAFRLAYFGYPLPNTYYVKVTPDKLYNLRFGLGYLYQFVKASPLVAPLILAALFSFFRNLPGVLRILITGQAVLSRLRLAEFCLAGMVLVGIVLPVLMGGDIFGGFRFYQPVWPLLILVLFYLPLPAHWWQLDKPRITLTVAAVTLVMLTWSNALRWPGIHEDRGRVAHLFELTERLSLTGEYLQRLFADYPDGLPSAGVSAAGGSKINYAGEVIDLMGLNFTPMAHHDGDKKGTRGHAAFNKKIFWEHAPVLFEPTLCPRNRPPVNRAIDPENWLFEIYRGLPADERFVKSYSFVALDVPGTTDRICTYVRNDWLRAMEASGRFGIQRVE